MPGDRQPDEEARRLLDEGRRRRRLGEYDAAIAHAHLLLGHTAEALECYTRLGGRYHPRKERYGRDLVLEDLRLLQAAGLQVPQAGGAVQDGVLQQVPQSPVDQLAAGPDDGAGAASR